MSAYYNPQPIIHLDDELQRSITLRLQQIGKFLPVLYISPVFYNYYLLNIPNVLYNKTQQQKYLNLLQSILEGKFKKKYDNDEILQNIYEILNIDENSATKYINPALKTTLSSPMSPTSLSYKPSLIRTINNFLWRGNLCWLYAYLQYIYRIKVFHDLIIDNVKINKNNIQINFTNPELMKYNNPTEFNFQNMIDYIKERTNKNFIFKKNNTSDDKILLEKIYTEILSILKGDIYYIQYVIFSLKIIFSYLDNPDIDNPENELNSLYKYTLDKKLITPFNPDNNYTKQEFIHIFILFIAYFTEGYIIYTSMDPITLHNQLKHIFNCLDGTISNKSKDQTCFIIFIPKRSHYINIITTGNNYYLVDSIEESGVTLLNDSQKKVILDLINSQPSRTIITYKYNGKDHQILYGGN